MESNKTALLLINPGSGAGAANLDAGLECLRDHGVDVIREQPKGPDHVARVIRRYRDKVDRVIVGGGDGTMNMSLKGLLEHDLPMGVLALGTANDFARTLGIPEDPLQACEIIAKGNIRRIDVGEVNQHPFFNVAHIGLAVEVARRSDGDMKKRLGALAYPYAAWTAFRTRKTFSVALECGGQSRSLRAVQVSVGNGRFYGGGIPIAEDAAIDDGRLDLYAIPAARGSRLLALIPALSSGRIKDAEDMVTMQGDSAEVRTKRPKTVAVDGEEMTQTPARFKVLKNALSVYVPTDGAAAMPGASKGSKQS